MIKIVKLKFIINLKKLRNIKIIIRNQIKLIEKNYENKMQSMNNFKL